MMKRFVLTLLSLSSTTAFIAPCPFSVSSSLSAKKSSSGQGFGKSPPTIQLDDEPPATSSTIDDEISPPTSNYNSDPSPSPEDRSKSILREKFGLKSYEEQRAMEGDARALMDAQSKEKKRRQLRNLENVWPEGADLFDVLPPSLLRGIDTTLKIGLGVCTALFVTAGVLITVEAGSKAMGYELPEGLEEWVVNVVEPNFTPLLFVLLGFSVGLGLFSAGQLGSKGSVYREDP